MRSGLSSILQSSLSRVQTMLPSWAFPWEEFRSWLIWRFQPRLRLERRDQDVEEQDQERDLRASA